MSLMFVTEAIQKAHKEGLRFRDTRCPYSDGIGVWYRTTELDDLPEGFWVCYDECGTLIKDQYWVSFEQLIRESWEVETK